MPHEWRRCSQFNLISVYECQKTARNVHHSFLQPRNLKIQRCQSTCINGRAEAKPFSETAPLLCCSFYLGQVFKYWELIICMSTSVFWDDSARTSIFTIIEIYETGQCVCNFIKSDKKVSMHTYFYICLFVLYIHMYLGCTQRFRHLPPPYSLFQGLEQWILMPTWKAC